MGKHPLPVDIKIKIQELRKQGHSIPEMHRLLGTSKSTLSRHIKNTQILPEYRQRWLDRRNASKIISEKAWADAKRSADITIENINEKELKILGAALYWGEGAKKQFNFINSDPVMIKLFLYILINAFKVPLDSIKISIRLFEDISRSKATEFWSGVTGIILDEKTEINIIKGSKEGKLPYGMCRIRVKKGGLLLKSIFAINKRVTELVSFTSPRSSMDLEQ